MINREFNKENAFERCMKLWPIPLFLAVGLLVSNASAQTFGTDCDSAAPHFDLAANTVKSTDFKCLQYSLGTKTRLIAPEKKGQVKSLTVHWYLQAIQGLAGKCQLPDTTGNVPAGVCKKTLTRMCAASKQKISVVPGYPPIWQLAKLSGEAAECKNPSGGQNNPTGDKGCAVCILGESKNP